MGLEEVAATNPAAARRGAFRMAGRAGWALLDQGISSFTNFALGVLIARSVSAYVAIPHLAMECPGTRPAAFTI